MAPAQWTGSAPHCALLCGSAHSLGRGEAKDPTLNRPAPFPNTAQSVAASPNPARVAPCAHGRRRAVHRESRLPRDLFHGCSGPRRYHQSIAVPRIRRRAAETSLLDAPANGLGRRNILAFSPSIQGIAPSSVVWIGAGLRFTRGRTDCSRNRDCSRADEAYLVQHSSTIGEESQFIIDKEIFWIFAP